MHRFLRPFSLTESLLGFAIALSSGCGFSETVNTSVREQEKRFEMEISKLMLQQSELIVSSVQAHASGVRPQSTAHCRDVPGSTCTVCYVARPEGQSLDLVTPACTIEPPPETRDVSLELVLQHLSLAATRSSPTQVILHGQGRLDLTAQLPLFGTYKGVAQYEIRTGEVNTTSWAVQLDLRLTYQSGENSPLELAVTASGTPQNIQGELRGPHRTCQVSGSLNTPRLLCL
ncbi:MAG: hypothetical protein RMK29_02975 [Myxococcales bacterium]|nr:hypothetical protein [Myxococcota bacterium]MDW8280646.1 hypothetical protein [Myxococcales bacterium]